MEIPDNMDFHSGDAEEREYDALIVGASYSGLIAAAILANCGYRTAVIDALEQPGGRVGATRYRDCWISLGHRDGASGIGDIGQPNVIGRLAQREAGIEIPVRKGAYGNNRVRVHDPHLGSTTEVGMEDITTSSGKGDALDYYVHLIQAFVPEATDIRAPAEEVKLLFERAAAIPEEEAWRMVSIKMGEWTERQLRHPVARQFMINLMEAGHASPGEEASVGRWLLCFPWKYSSPDWVVDDEVGAMQTLITPWAKAVEAKGGELWLGWKPVEIIIDRPDRTGQGSGHRGHVSGVVAVNASNLVQVFRAPIVVCAHFGWNLPELLDAELLPDGFLDMAEATRKQQAEGAGWVGVFNRMPRLRATGEPETFSGWQRVLSGKGLARLYGGGFNWMSLTDPNSAPKGKHFLMVFFGHHGSSKHFGEVKALVDVDLAFMRKLYLDFDECLDWGRYHWVRAPQILAWHLKPTYRHPVKISTVEGLYCAASSAEGMSGWVDLEAQVALQAVGHIDRDFPRPNRLDGKTPPALTLPGSNLDWAKGDYH